jgi:HEAT repeat protein
MPSPLLDGAPADRVAAMAALLQRAPGPEETEIDALCVCLGDASKLVQRRSAEALAALATRGIPIAPRLRDALGADDPRRRWGAAYALALIDALPLDALPLLIDVLGSDDGDLRWAAADLVKRLATDDRAAVVAGLLAAAAVPGPRRKMALYSLRDLEVPQAFDAALAALADPHLETRLAALAVLARIHPDPLAAAHRVASLIDDADPRMQRAAAGTLGGLAIRSPDVLEALRRAEQSSDPSVRRAAARSLRLLE